MSSDEQRVRTMAGWIGVEISKSRVRTPGKEGYGLYRARPTPRSTDLPEDLDEMWTAYAFTLEEIERATREAIEAGEPSGPGSLKFWQGDRVMWAVATRWTSAYRGRRDLGAMVPTDGCAHGVGEPCPAGASMGEHAHDPQGCHVQGRPHLGPCVPGSGDTVRSRQRAHNAEFQADHLERRRYGLERRHAAKLKRNAQKRNEETL